MEDLHEESADAVDAVTTAVIRKVTRQHLTMFKDLDVEISLLLLLLSPSEFNSFDLHIR